MLYIVDDENNINDALEWIAGLRKINCVTCFSGEELLERLNIPLYDEEGDDDSNNISEVRLDPNGDCIILDVRMAGMSGLATFDRIIKKNLVKRLPVIFITGHGDLSSAVEITKRGAFDYFEKPFDDVALFRQAALGLEQSQKESDISVMRQRFESLTIREREILSLILVGKMNKVIADMLGISMRTVEVHRANILDKMKVKTAMELAATIR